MSEDKKERFDLTIPPTFVELVEQAETVCAEQERAGEIWAQAIADVARQENGFAAWKMSVARLAKEESGGKLKDKDMEAAYRTHPDYVKYGEAIAAAKGEEKRCETQYYSIRQKAEIIRTLLDRIPVPPDYTASLPDQPSSTVDHGSDLPPRPKKKKTA